MGGAYVIINVQYISRSTLDKRALVDMVDGSVIAMEQYTAMVEIIALFVLPILPAYIQLLAIDIGSCYNNSNSNTPRIQ